MPKHSPFAALAALVLLIALSGSAKAQKVENPWSLEGYAGIVLTTGNFSDIAESGFGAGALVGYSLDPDWVLLANVSYSPLKANSNFTEFPLTDWNIFGAFALVGYEFGAGESTRVMIPVGLGVAHFDPKDPNEFLSSSTNFALNGGVKFYYYFSPTVAISINGMGILAFADEAKLSSNTIWLFPLSAGLVLRF